ncbi:hypothetical protein Msil_1962 [Methylocella silvestris BL2]|uniref:Uncharacterized protein n=1 Tax=Methylocella silvestris (strain DSM 15510 / CIP 108128 / LMG 27833 / NCIMB 13906 / BL2) TaxID=395965 RepID=B8EPQ1_METSB|nr:hypothetical protein [Methylocella silvestris]ACK50905.1 hypothetical protein Msil_1962 [Methylocella silvestris BL2]
MKDTLSEIGGAVSESVTFVPPGDPREVTKDYAKIRIVFLPETGLHNHFKFRDYQTGMASEDWYTQLSQAYVAAIPFTPTSPTQVDGFLLSNADNSLGLAVCRIVAGLPRKVQKALINECLVRAMGLTELLPDKPQSTLGPWNRPYDATEMTPLADGDKSFWSLGTQAEKEKYFRELPIVQAARAPDVTDYDKRLLSILYCPDIKPGMDKYQAIIALLRNNTCFKKSNF